MVLEVHGAESPLLSGPCPQQFYASPTYKVTFVLSFLGKGSLPGINMKAATHASCSRCLVCSHECGGQILVEAALRWRSALARGNMCRAQNLHSDSNPPNWK